jgi:hypothetical protein
LPESAREVEVKKPAVEKPRSIKYEPLYVNFEENKNVNQIELGEAIEEQIHQKHDPNLRHKVEDKLAAEQPAKKTTVETTHHVPVVQKENNTVTAQVEKGKSGQEIFPGDSIQLEAEKKDELKNVNSLVLTENK